MTQSLLNRLALRIEKVLRERQWKRTSFAHGRLSPGTVRNVLKGKDYRLSTLAEVAEALDCDLIIDIQPRRMSSQCQVDPQHIAHET